MKNRDTKHAAFSLVELSIVLVILGLLVGGVLAGQSLIRAAELRSVASQYQQFTAAAHAFRDKYFALPGDMTNAESFWGTAAVANTDCRDFVSSSAATCNGDGDGNIEVLTTRSREIFRYWQHLSNAGLMEGSFSGTKAGAGSWDIAAGTNVPRAKVNGGVWTISAVTDIAAQGGFYLNLFPPAGSSHWFQVAAFTTWNLTPLFRNEEAWNIDTKLDDGKPGTGKVTTGNTTNSSTCASSNTASTATYQLGITSTACILLMGL